MTRARILIGYLAYMKKLFKIEEYSPNAKVVHKMTQ